MIYWEGAGLATSGEGLAIGYRGTMSVTLTRNRLFQSRFCVHHDTDVDDREDLRVRRGGRGGGRDETRWLTRARVRPERSRRRGWRHSLLEGQQLVDMLGSVQGVAEGLTHAAAMTEVDWKRLLELTAQGAGVGGQRGEGPTAGLQGGRAWTIS